MLNLTYSTNQTGFHVNFNKVNRPVFSWREEIKNTAIGIKNSTNKDIVVATSGGIDAEVACRGFLDAGIPFKVLIVEFEGMKNSHDVMYAHRFADAYNVEKIVCTINMEKFLSRDIYDYISQGYKATIPYRYFQIYLLETIEKLGCCGVVGSGDMFLFSSKQEICITLDQEYFLADQWCKNNSLLHCPAFHLATPELFASFLTHPVTQFITSNLTYVPTKDQWVNLNPGKIILYHSEYPDMERRQKYMGWENMMEQWVGARRKLERIFSHLPTTDLTLAQVRSQLEI